MSITENVRKHIASIQTAVMNLIKPRMTLKYPDVHFVPNESNYAFDPKTGTAIPGWKGRHLLYLDKCTGCNLCYVACENIAEAIVMVPLPDEKRPQNMKSLYPAVDYGRCLPPWTPIFTAEGTKPIQEVGVGYFVLTHTGRFRKVTHVFERSYTGPLYTFKTLGNLETLTVTKEHPVLVYEGGTTRWALPEQIKYRNYLTRPILRETTPLQTLTFYHEQYHPAGRGGYFTLTSNELFPSQKLMRLSGYYIAEGAADRYRVSFDISKREEKLAQDIITASRDAFQEEVSVKPDARSEGLKLVIDSVRAASFFRQFGTKCNQKHLPNWALFMPTDLQRELVKAVFLGDGHYSNKHYSYMHSNYFTIRTTSRMLADQLTYVLARLGVVASVSIQKQVGRKGCCSVTVHTPYVAKMAAICGVSAEDNGPHSHSYIKMVDTMIVSPVVDIRVDYVKHFKVFNLEVEEDQSYVASNQIVHNCVFCGFCVDLCPFYALEMTPDQELSEYRRESLFYTPHELAIPPRKPARPYASPKFEGERVRHVKE